MLANFLKIATAELPYGNCKFSKNENIYRHKPQLIVVSSTEISVERSRPLEPS